MVWIECQLGTNRASERFELRGSVVLGRDRLLHGEYWLWYSESTRPARLGHGTVTIRNASGSRTTRLRFTRVGSGLHPRLAKGNAIEGLTLRWERSGSESGGISTGQRRSGNAELIVMHDFSPVHVGAVELANRAERRRTDALSARPFRATVSMPALLAAIGLEPTAWCCGDVSTLPRIRVVTPSPGVDPVAGNHVRANESTLLLRRHCGTCHSAESRFPPGFLAGGSERVEAQIRACAPRILQRMTMWMLDPEDRNRSPMPPATALPALGYTAETWKSSQALSELLTLLGGFSRTVDRTRRAAVNVDPDERGALCSGEDD